MREYIINKESDREERTQEQWRSGQEKKNDKRMSGNERAAARCYEPHERSPSHDNDDCTDKTHTRGRSGRRRMIEEERNVLTQIKRWSLASGRWTPWTVSQGFGSAGPRYMQTCWITQRPRPTRVRVSLYVYDPRRPSP